MPASSNAPEKASTFTTALSPKPSRNILKLWPAWHVGKTPAHPSSFASSPRTCRIRQRRRRHWRRDALWCETITKAKLFGRKCIWRRNMSDTSHVLEASHLSEGKGFFERLLDFSFQHFITQKYAKLLYGIHLLLGLIAGTWYVFNGFQASTSEGLLN